VCGRASERATDLDALWVTGEVTLMEKNTAKLIRKPKMPWRDQSLHCTVTLSMFRNHPAHGDCRSPKESASLGSGEETDRPRQLSRQNHHGQQRHRREYVVVIRQCDG
jgi:hypothetical protein